MVHGFPGDQREQRWRRVGASVTRAPRRAIGFGTSQQKASRPGLQFFPANAGGSALAWVRWVSGVFEEKRPETAPSNEVESSWGGVTGATNRRQILDRMGVVPILVGRSTLLVNTVLKKQA